MHPEVDTAKFEALVEGAEVTSQQLGRKTNLVEIYCKMRPPDDPYAFRFEPSGGVAAF